MRNYCRFYFGRYHEHSDALSVDLDLEFISSSTFEFDAQVAQYDKEVRDANFDWTGGLTFKAEIWLLLNKAKALQLIELVAPHVNNILEALVTAGLVVYYDPRKTWSHGK